MTYVEGFVIPVPQASKEAYRSHAAAVAPLFRDFGTARTVQCWGEQLPEGKITDFRRAVDAAADEVVMFSWMEFPSRAVRDAAIAKSSADPQSRALGGSAPFDGRRMVFGGFEIISEVAGKDIGGAGYVDGVLVAVPKDGKSAYVDFAHKVGALFVEHGASRVVDAWEDDVPDGKLTDYRRALKVEPGEAVVYSWIEWPSRAVRETGWERAMADARMNDLPMPFDGKRMIYGGFTPLLDLGHTGETT